MDPVGNMVDARCQASRSAWPSSIVSYHIRLGTDPASQTMNHSRWVWDALNAIVIAVFDLAQLELTRASVSFHFMSSSLSVHSCHHIVVGGDTEADVRLGGEDILVSMFPHEGITRGFPKPHYCPY